MTDEKSYRQKQREYNIEQIERMKPCEGCKHASVYSKSIGTDGKIYDLKCCVYILDTGCKRPCPPGEGCMVKEIGIRKDKLSFDAIPVLPNHRRREDGKEQ